MSGENLSPNGGNNPEVGFSANFKDFEKYLESINKQREEGAKTPETVLESSIIPETPEDSGKTDTKQQEDDIRALEAELNRINPDIKIAIDLPNEDKSNKYESNEHEIAKITSEYEDIIKTREELDAEARQIEVEETRQRELEKAGQRNSELAKQEEIEKYTKELIEVDQERTKLEQMELGYTPLVAINIDRSHDEKELAHDLAEQALNADVAKGNAIQRILKGTLFKKYFEKKYEKEFLSGERVDEEGRKISDIIKAEAPEIMERFVLGAVEDDKFIHREIGKKDKNGNYKDGEKLEKLDEETNEKIKNAIAEYARKSPERGEDLNDLNRDFENEINCILFGPPSSEKQLSEAGSNYLAVAKEAADRYIEISKNAKTKAEHDKAIALVMAGFQAYNAEARNNVRTEAHREHIDKIVDKLESSKIGQFIPAEILAGATGIVMGLTQTGVRVITGVAGGIGASAIISGLKERNRITEDRVRMMRDIANGMDYSGRDLSDEEIKKLSRADRKTAKYEASIGGTLYDIRKASDLTARLNEVLDPENKSTPEDILRAIAEARVRIDFSDSEQKDLIAYSSADKRGRERLDLDIAVIRAEKSLSEKDKELLQKMKEEIKNQIIEGYEDEAGEHHAGVAEKDKSFKHFRAIAAAKKAGKTLALGSAIFFGSQEAMALIDPNKIGIFEKAGIIKTDNNFQAEETLLARGFGHLTGTADIHENVTDPSQIRHYEEAGYTKVETAPGTPTYSSSTVQVDPSASTSRVNVKYDGWANNGTKLYYNNNGFYAPVENGNFVAPNPGAATPLPTGQKINYLASQAKAYVTVGDSKFEVLGKLNEATGQMAWGENGVLTTTAGDTIKVIGNNGEKLYKYFEIAMDGGVDADGVQHIIPLATDVGANTFSGKIEQAIDNIVTKTGPTYTFIRGVSLNGLGFAPETARTGLGEVQAANTAPEEISGEISEVETGETESAPREETPLEAPEGVFENTEPSNPTSTNESLEEAVRDFAANYEQEINANRALIGDELANALLSREDSGTVHDKEIVWGEAIRGLTPEGKNALKSILNMRSSLSEQERNSLKFGKLFNVYLAINPDILQ